MHYLPQQLTVFWGRRSDGQPVATINKPRNNQTIEKDRGTTGSKTDRVKVGETQRDWEKPEGERFWETDSVTDIDRHRKTD